MKHFVLILLVILVSCKSENTKLYDYNVEDKIKELGITLNKSSDTPIANYVKSLRVNDMVYLSGNGPKKPNGTFITGKVGTDLTIEEAYEAARIVAINQLSNLKTEIGDLNKVERIVSVFGMVNCATNFTKHPQVINGYSDVMVAVFGERGKHTRSAVGMSSLPFNIACEVEMIVKIKD